MAYIEGFVAAVPNDNKQKLIDYANEFDQIFLDYGATRVMECWGEDVPTGKQTDFYRAVAAKETESILFSWIEWPDKATRDKGVAEMEKLMETDPRWDPKKNPMPFDGARMIFGGFTPIVSMGK